MSLHGTLARCSGFSRLESPPLRKFSDAHRVPPHVEQASRLFACLLSLPQHEKQAGSEACPSDGTIQLGNWEWGAHASRVLCPAFRRTLQRTDLVGLLGSGKKSVCGGLRRDGSEDTRDACAPCSTASFRLSACVETCRWHVFISATGLETPHRGVSTIPLLGGATLRGALTTSSGSEPARRRKMAGRAASQWVFRLCKRLASPTQSGIKGLSPHRGGSGSPRGAASQVVKAVSAVNPPRGGGMAWAWSVRLEGEKRWKPCGRPIRGNALFCSWVFGLVPL